MYNSAIGLGDKELRFSKDGPWGNLFSGGEGGFDLD